MGYEECSSLVNFAWADIFVRQETQNVIYVILPNFASILEKKIYD